MISYLIVFSVLSSLGLVVSENDITTADSLQFDFPTIEAATSKFSVDNKLGEGGFGEVYKVCN